MVILWVHCECWLSSDKTIAENEMKWVCTKCEERQKTEVKANKWKKLTKFFFTFISAVCVSVCVVRRIPFATSTYRYHQSKFEYNAVKDSLSRHTHTWTCLSLTSTYYHTTHTRQTIYGTSSLISFYSIHHFLILRRTLCSFIGLALAQYILHIHRVPTSYLFVSLSCFTISAANVCFYLQHLSMLFQINSAQFARNEMIENVMWNSISTTVSQWQNENGRQKKTSHSLLMSSYRQYFTFNANTIRFCFHRFVDCATELTLAFYLVLRQKHTDPTNDRQPHTHTYLWFVVERR